MKKSRKLKTFLIEKIIVEKFNNELNKLSKIKTKNDMMFLDLKIF